MSCEDLGGLFALCVVFSVYAAVIELWFEGKRKPRDPFGR